MNGTCWSFTDITSSCSNLDYWTWASAIKGWQIGRFQRFNSTLKCLSWHHCFEWNILLTCANRNIFTGILRLLDASVKSSEIKNSNYTVALTWPLADRREQPRETLSMLIFAVNCRAGSNQPAVPVRLLRCDWAVAVWLRCRLFWVWMLKNAILSFAERRREEGLNHPSVLLHMADSEDPL